MVAGLILAAMVTGRKRLRIEGMDHATATPMSYTLQGRQYLLINAGGHAMYNRGTGDYLVAFALPETR